MNENKHEKECRCDVLYEINIQSGVRLSLVHFLKSMEFK